MVLIGTNNRINQPRKPNVVVFLSDTMVKQCVFGLWCCVLCLLIYVTVHSAAKSDKETREVLQEHAQWVFTGIQQHLGQENRIGLLLFGSLISDNEIDQSWTRSALLSKGKKTPQSISWIWFANLEKKNHRTESCNANTSIITFFKFSHVLERNPNSFHGFDRNSLLYKIPQPILQNLFYFLGSLRLIEKRLKKRWKKESGRVAVRKTRAILSKSFIKETCARHVMILV